LELSNKGTSILPFYPFFFGSFKVYFAHVSVVTVVRAEYEFVEIFAMMALDFEFAVGFGLSK